MDELRQLQQQIDHAWKLVHVDDLISRAAELEVQMSGSGFWDNPQEAQKITKVLNDIQKDVQVWQSLKRDVDDAAEMWEAAAVEGEGHESLRADLEAQIPELQKRFTALQQYVLLSGEHDVRDAIVSFHAGAGGVDAQDWAEILLRMIMRFSEKQDWSVEILDESRGGEAGIKSATIKVSGRYAYGKLRGEHGIHRLVRISPFDAESMRHTSFASIEVIPDFDDVQEFEIPEDELRVDVFRSGGKGGQGVNTTDSAVRVVHIPTGITVVCQNERSQHQNKATAMGILKSKLYAVKVAEQEAATAAERGEVKSAEWGNQIRSYVLQPYKMVKDHRTGHESKQPDDVLGGDLDGFVQAYLEWKQR